jgi:type I restriction enzyme S subunit
MSEAPAGFRRSKLGDEITLKRDCDLPAQALIPEDVPIVSSSGITGTHNEAKVTGSL